jgi:RimJ/RimL family protein N-acetyltransferase
MSQQPTLTTKRLLLRPFKLTDAKEVQRLAGDREIADTTLSIPHPYEDGMAEAWILKHEGMFSEGKHAIFAITQKLNGELIGAVGLHNILTAHQAELGYWICKSHWGQGFCTEAAGAVLRYAFTVFGLVRVHTNHLRRNPASGRVMQKLSMKHEGCQRQHVKKWDKFEDIELYGILKNEWEQSPK